MNAEYWAYQPHRWTTPRPHNEHRPTRLHLVRQGWARCGKGDRREPWYEDTDGTRERCGRCLRIVE